MKLSIEWINEYLSNKLHTADVAGILERAGVEVEDIISSTKLDHKIVVGLVKKVVQHPNADKLKLVDVDTGKAKLSVVCGASNVSEGQKVAVARVGAVLPDGTVISNTKIRGQASQGMICSEYELGLGDDHGGILILNPKAKPGDAVESQLGQGEILDITTAANRSDLQSVIGLAREVAAMGSVELKLPQMREIASDGKSPKVVIDSNKVQRYMLQQFTIDASHPTSDIAKRRLHAAGTRPINIAVDITNFVLQEYGQPLHAFDADKVKLPITVRQAKKGESLVTLDEVARSLTKDDLIIADRSGPIALAGVIGGLRTAVTEQTKQILVESATFDAVSVRKSAVRHGMRTDASARFERGLPVKLAEVGLQRAGDIIVSATGGKPVSKPYDSLKKHPAPVVIRLRHNRLEQLLGMKVSAGVLNKALHGLGFTVHGSETVSVTVPWWRTDMSLEEDIIEEVGRSVGYDDLPATLPSWNADTVTFDRRHARIWELKAALRSLGLFEVVTYSFISAQQLQGAGYDPEDHLKLKNPLSQEQEYLRSSLLPSLVSTTAKNARYSNEFGMFEISRVFDAPTDRTQLPLEPIHLAVIRRTEFSGIRDVLELISSRLHLPVRVESAEIVGLHPHRSGQVSLHGQIIGVVGEVHPAVAQRHKIPGPLSFIELDLDALLEEARDAVYQPISRYPAVSRDLSVIIPDGVNWADVARALKKYHVRYLSEFRGQGIPAGSRSLALRLTFVSSERTLTDAEADSGAATALDILKQEFKAQPRT